MEDLYKKVREQLRGDFYDLYPERIYAVAVLLTAVGNGSILTDPENLLLTKLSQGENIPNLRADILKGPLLADRFKQDLWDELQKAEKLDEQNRLMVELNSLLEQELRVWRVGWMMSEDERRKIKESEPRIEFLKRRIKELDQELS